MKHVLKMMDLSRRDIFQILDLADQLKYEKQHGMEHKSLKGKSIGMIFDQVSTRTRVSFETGVYQLGAQPLFLSGKDLQSGRGEPIQDTARVLSRYLDCLIIRTSSQQDVEDYVKYGSIPVINGLTMYSHPCQVLSDLLTMKEKYGALENLNLCFIGDGSNVANSLIVAGLTMNMNVSVATPKGYEPHCSVLEFAKQYPNSFQLTNDPQTAIQQADIVVTDTWASMGTEVDVRMRMQDFKGFTINRDLLSFAKEDVMVLHPLPAFRGQEISEDVFEEHAKEIFDDAENRLHVQKALLVLLLCGE
ncbi:ornithine carbamoyltransferase [Floccifex sp.]|uniref:ornithine carbamoyltransferase n=1 Tax=Floccifex sp. TaxID=2815810 RepID=UPI003F0B4267